MSFAASPQTLSDALSYRCIQITPTLDYYNECAWFMDTNEVEGSICLPDMSTQFDTQLDAVKYLLETGLPIWLIHKQSGLPVDVWTYSKFEFILIPRPVSTTIPVVGTNVGSTTRKECLELCGKG